jgi:hypothetical protein
MFQLLKGKILSIRVYYISFSKPSSPWHNTVKKFQAGPMAIKRLALQCNLCELEPVVYSSSNMNFTYESGKITCSS